MEVEKSLPGPLARRVNTLDESCRAFTFQQFQDYYGMMSAHILWESAMPVVNDEGDLQVVFVTLWKPGYDSASTPVSGWCSAARVMQESKVLASLIEIMQNEMSADGSFSCILDLCLIAPASKQTATHLLEYFLFDSTWWEEPSSRLKGAVDYADMFGLDRLVNEVANSTSRYRWQQTRSAPA